jgi:hypothetical protein
MIGLIPGAAGLITRNIGLLKWLIPAGLMIAAALYVWSLLSALDRAEATITLQRAQLTQAAEANQSLVASIDRLKRDHQQQLQALQRQADSAARAAAKAEKVRQYVESSKAAGGDGVAAPVLDGAVKRLRRARTDPADQNPDRTPVPTGSTADLPGQP